MPDTYHGYDTDLLRKIKHLGRAIVGDDALYAAAQEYTDPAKGGGLYGPALISNTPGTSVTPPAKVAVTLPVQTVANADAPADPWDGCDVVELKGIMQAHGITVPRTLTAGKAIGLLEAAGVTSPQQQPK